MNTTIRYTQKARRCRRTVAIIRAGFLAALLSVSEQTQLHAAGLLASDRVAGDRFGWSVSQSDHNAFVGAWLDDIGGNTNQGSAYIFRNIETATGTITQNAKLIASEGASGDLFGWSVSLSGNSGIAGAYEDFIGTNSSQGSAYLFRNLDTATGTITQNAKLIASDGAMDDQFGKAVSLSGNNALVGALQDGIGNNLQQGSAYLFRNLDTATGTITQNVKLIASDGATGDGLGSSVSLSGNSGLIGAFSDELESGDLQGSAYLFRNLDTASGTITENVKLIASDGAAGDRFGWSVSLSSSFGVVGAYEKNNRQGSAYVFRNLNTAMGTITENVKLIASDGAALDNFGFSVSQSGNRSLVGSHLDDIGARTDQGSAYLFYNLDSATGTITQNVKLINSDGAANDYFGYSVSLDGDQFLIGAYRKSSSAGKAYSGSVSSVTTLDTGSTSKTISQISFISQDDWVIGQTTNANQVTLSAGDTATVTAAGKIVRIGQNDGSDNNRLIIAGTLTATQINVGALGNTGNFLQLGTGGTTGTLSIGSIITNHGSVVFNRSVATTQGTHFGTAAISGTGSVIQAGTGTTTFNAANTYSGDTIVKAGTLKLDLNGGIANSANIIVGDAGSSGARLDVTTKTGGFTVGTLQTLKGIGQIDGNTTILGKHSPGNSPDLQSFNGNLGYSTGSQLNWELIANVSTDTFGLRGTSFDGMNVIGAGILTIQAGVTSNLIFNGSGSTVDWNDPFWDSDHTWLVYDNTTFPMLTTGSIFHTINVSTDSLGATLTVGTFTWSAVGNDVQLNFTAIPEPSTWVTGALSLLGLGVAARRRGKKWKTNK